MKIITGATIKTAQTGPRVELDAEGSWYCDDSGIRIPWAEYLAARAGWRPWPWW